MKQHPVNGQLTSVPHNNGFCVIMFINGEASYIGKDGKKVEALSEMKDSNLFTTSKAAEDWIDALIKKDKNKPGIYE